jgi:hypothetical protein
MSYIEEYYDESSGYYITNDYLAKHATDIELAYEAEAGNQIAIDEMAERATLDNYPMKGYV